MVLCVVRVCVCVCVCVRVCVCACVFVSVSHIADVYRHVLKPGFSAGVGGR
jgi:hypothetical protein